jgi:hypothetical protein
LAESLPTSFSTSGDGDTGFKDSSVPVVGGFPSVGTSGIGLATLNSTGGGGGGRDKSSTGSRSRSSSSANDKAGGISITGVFNQLGVRKLSSLSGGGSPKNAADTEGNLNTGLVTVLDADANGGETALSGAVDLVSKGVDSEHSSVELENQHEPEQFAV